MKRLFPDKRTGDEAQEDRDRIISYLEMSDPKGVFTHEILEMLSRRTLTSSHREDLRSTLDELEKLGILKSTSNVDRKKGRRWQLACPEEETA